MIQAQPFLRWQVVIDFHMAHHILTSLYYLLLTCHLSNYEKNCEKVMSLELLLIYS